MGNLHLEVVTPEKILISQEVDMVVAPGILGEFGVLEGHVPFLSGIVPGELRYTLGDKIESFAVTSGFAEVVNDKVSILVDAAESGRNLTKTNLASASTVINFDRYYAISSRHGKFDTS